MQKILIIGATSAIAESVARLYAARGAALYLAGRSAGKLDTIAADLRVRGAQRAEHGVLDVNDVAAHGALLDTAWSTLGGIDTVLIAHGTLPDQAACDASVDLSLREFATNGTSTIALAAALAQRLQSGATLAVISSVAGDRGRASNYLYGSAKAAVTAYLSGLGQRLRPAGVNVLVIKPGFVDTPMTAAFKKGALWATPDKVAAGILRAIGKRRAVAYLPGFWWAIMMIIKNIPEFVFRRIKL
ncbi:SDR family oxidoreductase [Mesorhizobium sp. M00.F.Ca.ET.151.01.1.1]|uniref:SDR family oxidoreductase n=2 Tax=Pseudomonadota TaxID=1224 RepID=UPI00113FBF55|nr:SDR family oxidoreductase [Stenotrophomonas pavanii]MBN7837911.1 SDR family oxidoreductase [Stenotrophomonas maltophilia]TGR49975.1 SDR family oxidoreductase [bacterium M00.F.Ca.ET.199.01.1.1]TGT06188.1 SDR family oxidoreductase [bacterium M00.F.Ca.ET.177.01.1.1]TGT61810.1 SDR family oxidoreductase [Mesorhizobium sp. M00.F.Ca.ET.170.01.1.1]TGU13413.1 SDR family oxidoreductase [bacterium M00.F.Ca.ET.163.01.1.1]TGU95373.1 SDR family oxidoreductase [Mesorhizobium sp. M00.F.Ca.ET.151.01.1.1]T